MGTPVTHLSLFCILQSPQDSAFPMYLAYIIDLGGSEVKASVSNGGDLGSIPVLGSSPGEGNGTPLQYSCLGNPIDGGAW